MILCGLAKAIAHHSLTGLNIWILSSFMMICLIFDTAIITNRKNWRTTIKLHFENFSIFLKTWTYTHARTSPPPVRFCSLFNDHPLPLFNERALNDPLLDYALSLVLLSRKSEIEEDELDIGSHMSTLGLWVLYYS